jgi:hypothetical protein
MSPSRATDDRAATDSGVLRIRRMAYFYRIASLGDRDFRVCAAENIHLFLTELASGASFPLPLRKGMGKR